MCFLSGHSQATISDWPRQGHRRATDQDCAQAAGEDTETEEGK